MSMVSGHRHRRVVGHQARPTPSTARPTAAASVGRWRSGREASGPIRPGRHEGARRRRRATMAVPTVIQPASSAPPRLACQRRPEALRERVPAAVEHLLGEAREVGLHLGRAGRVDRARTRTAPARSPRPSADHLAPADAAARPAPAPVTPKAGTIDSTPPTSAPSIGRPSSTTTTAMSARAGRTPRLAGPVDDAAPRARSSPQPNRAKARLPSPVNRPATATE